MAVVTETPTNYTIYTDAGTVPAGAASAFRPALNGYIGTVESRVQTVQANLERVALCHGYGAVSGGTVTAGVGLNVIIGAFEAVVGNYVRNDAIGTVGGLTSNTTNYVFLHQDGTFAVNTTGTNPGTATAHGTAILWATAVTGTGTVTSVSNIRQQYAGGTIQMHAVSGVVSMGQPWGLGVGTATVNALTEQVLGADIYCQPKIYVTGTAVGTCNLVVGTAPLTATWMVVNKGTASVKVKTAAGGGVVIASLKTAILTGTGSDVERVTADT
jgi:hypothetical protein